MPRACSTSQSMAKSWRVRWSKRSGDRRCLIARYDYTNGDRGVLVRVCRHLGRRSVSSLLRGVPLRRQRANRRRARPVGSFRTEACDGGARLGVRVRNKPIPKPGDLSVVTLFSGRPVCVIETTEVKVVAFCDVDADFASSEGEGDGSLAYWRRVHTDYFGRECARLGREFACQHTRGLRAVRRSLSRGSAACDLAPIGTPQSVSAVGCSSILMLPGATSRCAGGGLGPLGQGGSSCAGESTFGKAMHLLPRLEQEFSWCAHVHRRRPRAMRCIASIDPG